MERIESKKQLEDWLSVKGAGAPANSYSQYAQLLATWMEPNTAGWKQRIKASALWRLLKKLLPLYRGIKGFFWNCAHLGIGEAFHEVGQRIAGSRPLRRKRNRGFVAALMPEEAARQKQREESSGWQLCVSILAPLYNTPERYLRDMIASVQSQTYEGWQLCLADGSDEAHSFVGDICREYAGKDGRITYQKLEKNAGISENTNACIRMAKGEYLAFFDHDDMLHPSALYECVKAIRLQGAEFVYTDELTFLKDKLEDVVTKHYKPDFSPENLRGVNYICHLSVFRKSLLEETGLLDHAYDGSQDHDIILKLTAAAKVVCHIPKILYFWRVHPDSVSMDIGAKEYAIEAGRRAVRDHELRQGRKATVVSTSVCATHYRLSYELPARPLISILVLGTEERQILRLLSSIYHRTTYENYEICVGASLEEVLSEASGEYAVFLSENTDIAMPDWLQMLLMYVGQEEIGLAAGRLVGPEGRLIEAGYITGLDPRQLVTPIGQGALYKDLGYMGRMYYAHNVSACSLEGAMIRREHLKLLLEPKQQGLCSMRYRGLGLSGSLRAAGLRIVMNPYVIFVKEQPEMISHEELQRAGQVFSVEPDPYYNPNLSRDGSWKT